VGAARGRVFHPLPAADHEQYSDGVHSLEVAPERRAGCVIRVVYKAEAHVGKGCLPSGGKSKAATLNPHFSPGSRMLAQGSRVRAPLWSEGPARGAEQGPRRSRGCDRR
jgi:hypothetical protein